MDAARWTAETWRTIGFAGVRASLVAPGHATEVPASGPPVILGLTTATTLPSRLLAGGSAHWTPFLDDAVRNCSRSFSERPPVGTSGCGTRDAQSAAGSDRQPESQHGPVTSARKSRHTSTARSRRTPPAKPAGTSTASRCCGHSEDLAKRRPVQRMGRAEDRPGGSCRVSLRSVLPRDHPWTRRGPTRTSSSACSPPGQGTAVTRVRSSARRSARSRSRRSAGRSWPRSRRPARTASAWPAASRCPCRRWAGGRARREGR